MTTDKVVLVAISAHRNLLLGISSNEGLHDVSLNLANNGLGATGGGIVEACMADNTNITELDLTDNSACLL